MTSQFSPLRFSIGILGAVLLATGFVAAAVGPAYTAPIAVAQTV